MKATPEETLCDEYGYENRYGAVHFSRGFFPKLCKELGIDWRSLTRNGRARLKSDAIQTYMRGATKTTHRAGGFHDAEYYDSIK